MTKVVLGRYPATIWGCQNLFERITYGSDSFSVPEYDLFGIAFSFHHYHLYPISGRDVQLAFDIVRTTLNKFDYEKPTGTEFLQNLLRAVHHDFAQIDIHTHLAGLEFEPTGLIDLPAPVDDPQAEPLVHIMLLQLHQQYLSIASVGAFQVYAIRSTEQEVIFGWDNAKQTQVGGVRDFPGPFLAKRIDQPMMSLWEVKVQSGDLILATTPTLPGLITVKGDLQKCVSSPRCNSETLEAIDHHLKTMLNSSSHLDGFIGLWGAAWVIACVE